MLTEEELGLLDEANDTDVVRYEKAFLATRRILDECIRNLAMLEATTFNSRERQSLANQRLELETQRKNLFDANVAFHSQQAAMTPPSPSQVAELNELAKEVTRLTMEGTTAQAILRISTSALNKFASIQDIDPDS